MKLLNSISAQRIKIEHPVDWHRQQSEHMSVNASSLLTLLHPNRLRCQTRQASQQPGRADKVANTDLALWRSFVQFHSTKPILFGDTALIISAESLILFGAKQGRKVLGGKVVEAFVSFSGSSF